MQKAQKIGISDSKINIPREKKLKKILKMKEKVVEGKIYRRKMRVKMKKGNDANRNERWENKYKKTLKKGKDNE